MSRTASSLSVFLLTLFDRAQWCPVLQARFEVADLDRLRAMLDANIDANLECIYCLDDAEAVRLAEVFDIKLDWTALNFPDREFQVHRLRSVGSVPFLPYLSHTGYELPLLLDGRKKLARFAEPYPPMTFAGEDRFDHWVAAGRLHKDVVIETFAAETAHRLSRKGIQGMRTVHYAPIGEEWRIPAMKQIWDAASKTGGWNEYFERLEGMLFGYEDWQNDWWIETRVNSSGFGGMRLWCPVDDAGLAWIKSAGYRALPPINRPTLMLDNYDADLPDARRLALHDNGSAPAIAVFGVRGNGILDLFKGIEGPPWHLPAAKIALLNTLLLRSITIKPMQEALSD